jgi:E3 ubiquitin-protein ligase HERC3
MGDALPFVELGEDVFVVQVAAGQEHTCALTDEGRVKCWGANSTADEALRPVDVGRGRSVRAFGVTSRSTCAWLDDDSIRCWGGGFQAPLASDTPERTGDGLPLVVTREDLLGPSK